MAADWPLVNITDYINILKQVVPQEHHEEFFYGNALNGIRAYKKFAAGIVNAF